MSYTPDQLNNAIESGLAPRDPEIAGLARLAGRLAYLSPAGPSAAASDRMALRFEAVMAGEHRRGWLALVGFTPAGRPLSFAHRLAAGVALVGLLGGATSVATGVSPAEAARGTAHFIASAIANLAPNEDAGFAPDTATGLEPDGPVATQASADNNGAPEPGTPAPGISGNTPAKGDDSSTPHPTATPGGSVTPIPTPATAAATPPSSATPGSSSTSPTPIPGFSFPAAPPTTFPGQGPIQGPEPEDEPSHTPTSVPSPSSTPTAVPSSTPTPTPTSTPVPTSTPTPSPTSWSGHHDDGEDDDEHETPEPTETPEPEDDH
ncbi:MAG: hypothetical protein AB7N24_00775 [Dehalococcoidia bacterium]